MYVARAFGMDEDQIRKYDRDKDKRLDFAVRMLVILISTIDPQTIVVMGETFEDRDALRLGKACAAIVGESHVPKIQIRRDVMADYACGLIRLALNRIDFPLSEPM